MNLDDIFNKLKNGEISNDDASLLITNYNKKKEITYKLSEKGAISFYGLRKMPITLYIQEIDKIKEIINSNDFSKFILDNDKLLSKK